MSQLTNIPKQSYFSAQLETAIDASQTTGIILTAVPSYTPTGETIRFNILDSGGVETISATGWTGTELTGVTRGVDTYDGESATGLPHGGGITVVLSDDWTYFEDIQTAVNSKFDTAGGTITGATDFSGASTTFRIPNLTEAERDALTPANGMLVYNTTAGEFQYYDGGAWQTVGTASVPNASETVAGIVELATAAQSGSATSTGETGARLVMPNSLNVTTSAGAADAGKNPVLNASGFLDPTILNAQTTSTADAVVRGDGSGKIDSNWISYVSIFGDGSDGDVTISVNTSLSRDMYYNNLTVNDGVTLNPNGFRIFVKETLDTNATGKVASNGNNGGNGANFASGGSSVANGGTAGAAAYTTGSLPIPKPGEAGANGIDSNNGVNGANGDDATYSVINSAGAAGGDGGQEGLGTEGSGGSAGAVTSQTISPPYSSFAAYALSQIVAGTLNQSDVTPGSGSGGSGTGDGGANFTGGAGGGSGSTGGVVWIFAKDIATLTAEAIGGLGGDGGNGRTNVGTETSGGGGGGGGNGGLIILNYITATTINTDVSGGTGGTGGTGGVGGASNGQDGGNGNDGLVITLN